jgi:CRISPR/Cas system-associated exonuclease Cas4 (RecB family)
MSAATILKKVIESNLREGETRSGESLGYIRPSSLSWGCLLYVAREILRTPKPELNNQVKRILDSGTASHDRISKYFANLIVAKELPFVDREYRLRGQCDALIYIPPHLDATKTGFYVVEIKTINALEYDRLKQAGQPREDHILQCQIYIWGLNRYYRVFSPRGSILYYENRDTLEYLLFDVEQDEPRLTSLLDQVNQMLVDVRHGRLPEDQEPVAHCSYCAYLKICDVGQRAVAQRRQEGGGLPDRVLAKIIAERIVNKKRLQQPKRQAPRSLEELSSQLGWGDNKEQVSDDRQPTLDFEVEIPEV